MNKTAFEIALCIPIVFAAGCSDRDASREEKITITVERVSAGPHEPDRAVAADRMEPEPEPEPVRPEPEIAASSEPAPAETTAPPPPPSPPPPPVREPEPLPGPEQHVAGVAPVQTAKTPEPTVPPEPERIEPADGAEPEQPAPAGAATAGHRADDFESVAKRLSYDFHDRSEIYAYWGQIRKTAVEWEAVVVKSAANTAGFKIYLLNKSLGTRLAYNILIVGSGQYETASKVFPGQVLRFRGNLLKFKPGSRGMTPIFVLDNAVVQ